MKRLFAVMLLAVMVLSLFVGCGKKAAEETKPASTGNAGSGASSTPSSVVSGTKADAATGTSGLTEAQVAELEVHPSDDAVLRIAGAQEQESWQQLQMGFASKNVSVGMGLLYDTLIGWDSNTSSLTPSIATSWEWVNDTTLRLHLRDDVNSINGDPFTASDLLWGIKQTLDVVKLDTYYKNIFDVDKCKVVDDYTFDLAVQKPYPFLTIDLAHKAYLVNVEKSAEAAGGIEATKDNPISGTGPYKLVDYKPGQYAFFERRDNYWGQMPYYKRVEYYYVPDATTRAMGLEAGDYDFVEKVSNASAERLEGDPNYTVIYTKDDSNILLCINSDHEPLNIKEVRQALALSINYQALIQVAAYGHAVGIDGLVTPMNEYYTEPDPSKPQYIGNYDVAAAKQKLIDAGYPDGFTIDIHYRTSDSKWVDTVNILIKNFADIGVTLVPVQCETAVYYTDSTTGNFDTLVYTSNNPNPRRICNNIDPRTSQQTSGSQWIPDGTLDLIDRAVVEIDEAKRHEMFTELNNIVREYVPLISLFAPQTPWIMIGEIKNYMTDSFGNPEIESIYPDSYLG